MGSVPRKMAKGSREFQHPTGIEPKSPDSLQLALRTQPLVRVSLLKKMVYNLPYYLKSAFCIKDCQSRIAQVEYQGQTCNTKILERKPLIDTSCRIQHRLKLKYSHFGQFC